jgi:acyl carrier protein
MNDIATDTEQRLLEWCRRRFGVGTPITAETDLLSEGLLDSLLVMDLVNSIEKEHGVSIDNAEISPRNFRSVRALAALVGSRCDGRGTSES